MSGILSWLTSTNPEIRAPIAISLGAIPGALSRYYLTGLFAEWFGLGFPYGTFFINITGSLIMGLFMTFTLNRTSTLPDIRLFVAVGFLGSYTTFSTYALDSSALIRSALSVTSEEAQNYPLALLYWLGSAVLGVLGLEMGSWIARRFL